MVPVTTVRIRDVTPRSRLRVAAKDQDLSVDLGWEKVGRCHGVAHGTTAKARFRVFWVTNLTLLRNA